MPNTEVKLLNVDGTWWATAWESRQLPERRVYVKDNGDVIFHVYEKRKYSSIAQLAEHMTVNHRVAGSSPAGRANEL